ncbi:MAG: hypothetical protein F6K19_10475 [Cyanothece sp. SIO1E1]|nr:hypothetical protein [Cyanothece sp. SIO1E1]
MGMGLKGLLGAMALVAVSMAYEPVAVAQDETLPTLQEATLDVYYGDSGDFFKRRSLLNQIKNILGPFPELRLERDSDEINEFFVEISDLQNSSDPTLRVPDLASPYNSSLLLLPTPQSGSRAIGSELLFEQVPLR